MPVRIMFWSGPTTQNLKCVTKQAKNVNPDQGIFGFLIVFPVPGPCCRGRFGADFGWKPSANKRPGQFGTGFWSVRIRFPANTEAKSAPEARPGDWKLYAGYLKAVWPGFFGVTKWP